MVKKFFINYRFSNKGRTIVLCVTCPQWVLPLKIIIINCLSRYGFFLIHGNMQMWCRFIRKVRKNVKGNYQPISLLTIFGKILEKLKKTLFTHILLSHESLNPNRSGCSLRDATIYQLLLILHTIFKAFDCYSGLMFAQCTLPSRRHLIEYGTTAEVSNL